MGKEFKNGQFIGLSQITEDVFENREKTAKKALKIPTKLEVFVSMSAKAGPFCQGGNIDNCVHYASCALCVDPSRIETALERVPVYSLEETLDVEACLNQQMN